MTYRGDGVGEENSTKSSKNPHVYYITSPPEVSSNFVPAKQTYFKESKINVPDIDSVRSVMNP